MRSGFGDGSTPLGLLSGWSTEPCPDGSVRWHAFGPAEGQESGTALTEDEAIAHARAAQQRLEAMAA